MRAISETYNRAHKIFDIFLSQEVKRNVVITNKNGKSELINQLPNDVRLKKISEFHVIIV